MTTGRRPRHDADELDTGCALEDLEDAPSPQPTAYSTGERRRRLNPDHDVDDPRMAVGSHPLRDPFFDAGKDDPDAPANVDLADRVAALEKSLPSAAANATWIRRGVLALSLLAGLGTGVFGWALVTAEHKGDATGAAREREATFQWLLRTVRDDIVPGAARRDARIDALVETLRLYFPAGALRMQGPNLEPLRPVSPP